MKKLSLICVVLLLAACSSSDDDHNNSGPGGGVTPPTPPVAMVDAFFTMVSQYLTPTSEDTDATPIDAVVATQPENTEPVEFS